MGGVEDYHSTNNRKLLAHQQTHCSTLTKLKIFLLIISTNVVTVYLLTGFRPAVSWFDGGSISSQLNSTQSEIDLLRRRLVASDALIETLLAELRRWQTGLRHPSGTDGWPEELSGELKLAVGPHKLPLGRSPNFGSDELYLPLGAACRTLREDVARYMSYDVGGECPSDEVFAQRLMLKGCEPLPRRRCRPKSPVGYVEPRPLPESLWATPPDTSIVWDAYTCKNYDCLVHRSKDPRSYDCKDCFDLNGREKGRWLVDGDGLDYGMDAILGYKPPRTVRIGLDLGGGSGTFAARMRERNVTIISTTMNFDGPFNSFIASRGLIPIHVSISHRLPFYDNTLDIVHSMHVLSNWIPSTVLELALFDVYRVLRPGGLFWLDHFFCVGDQLNGTYAPMIGRIGFKRLRWNAGRKLDRGIKMKEWYLSALLEKPMT